VKGLPDNETQLANDLKLFISSIDPDDLFILLKLELWSIGWIILKSNSSNLCAIVVTKAEFI
jgi:hypothetical protein